MSWRIALTLIALSSGCAVGPGYHPAPVVPAGTRVGAGSRADSSFFDSLARARASDTAAARVLPLPPRPIAAESIADLAWLDILHDSLLTRLVTTALRQNRDIAVAEARIREYRALAGVARSPLFPSVTANGSASKNQIANPILLPGSPAVISYDAWVATASVAWELDFWGRIRRGLQAANADLGGQQAAAQAAVLSLVSDVALPVISDCGPSNVPLKVMVIGVPGASGPPPQVINVPPTFGSARSAVPSSCQHAQPIAEA